MKSSSSNMSKFTADKARTAFWNSIIAITLAFVVLTILDQTGSLDIFSWLIIFVAIFVGILARELSNDNSMPKKSHKK